MTQADRLKLTDRLCTEHRNAMLLLARKQTTPNDVVQQLLESLLSIEQDFC